MKRTLFLILCIVQCVLCINLKAQEETQLIVTHDSILFQDTLMISDTIVVKLSTQDYFDMLTSPDSVTGAVMNIYQDSAIFVSIAKKDTEEAEEAKGFRIQIYSSNRGAIARERAFEIKDILVSKHPKLADEIYISYTSPFWKVRIGNCVTNAQAQELRQWIIAEFPEFTTETYIVPSMIYVY